MVVFSVRLRVSAPGSACTSPSNNSVLTHSLRVKTNVVEASPVYRRFTAVPMSCNKHAAVWVRCSQGIFRFGCAWPTQFDSHILSEEIRYFVSALIPRDTRINEYPNTYRTWAVVIVGRRSAIHQIQLHVDWPSQRLDADAPWPTHPLPRRSADHLWHQIHHGVICQPLNANDLTDITPEDASFHASIA